jgi:hypothetical protein
VLTCQGKTVAKAIRSIDEFYPGTPGHSGIARQFKSIDVIDVLSDLFILRGVPGISIRIMARIS